MLCHGGSHSEHDAEHGAEQDAERLFPVAVESIGPGPLGVDLYWRHCARCPASVYLPAGSVYSEEHGRGLGARGTEFLYVPVAQHAAYRRVLRERLNSVFGDEGQGREERAKVIRASCARMIEDVLILPGQREPIECVREIARDFARWSAERSGEFSYLLDMSAHDFYTTTHMLNVGVGCGMLARRLRPDDAAFCEAVLQGGLLHDIGKRGIPPDVLNKEGKLSDAEWELVRAHPMAGYRELAAHDGIPPEVLVIARDHHERMDGRGYPFGLAGERIPLAARICSVVDVFDAIVAARPYRGPMSPAHALRIMGEGAGTHFDAEVLGAWTGLVEELISADPDRAVSEFDDSGEVLLGDLEAGPAAGAAAPGSALSLGVHERRAFPRFPVRPLVRGIVVRPGATDAASEGTTFQVRAVNMSRGGMTLTLPWALAVEAVVELRIPFTGGRTVRKRARVVRVERVRQGEWTVSVEFATPLGEQAPRVHAA